MVAEELAQTSQEALIVRVLRVPTGREIVTEEVPRNIYTLWIREDCAFTPQSDRFPS
jgi:hypothetical protein